MTFTVSRRAVALCAVTLVTLLFIIFVLPMFSAQHGAERAVNKLMDAFEVNDMDAVSDVVADDYADPWKFTHDEVVDFAKVLRSHIYACSVSRTQDSVTLSEVSKNATIAHTLRLFGKGKDSYVDAMIQGSSAIPTKVTFTLRRNSWKPWDWQITQIETPYSNKARGYKKRLEQITASEHD